MLIRSYKSAAGWLFIVLLIITASAILFNVYSRTSQVELELTKRIIEQMTGKVIQRTSAIFEAAENDLRINATIAGGKRIHAIRDELHAVFWQQLGLTPQLLTIHAADKAGNFVQSVRSPRLATRVIDRSVTPAQERIVYRDQTYRPIAHIKGDAEFDPRTRPWFRAGQGDEILWSDVYIFSENGQHGITASYPVVDANGEVGAVMAVDIALQGLSDFLSKQEIAETGAVFIVDSKDRLVAHPYQLGLEDGEDKAKKVLSDIQDLEQEWIRDSYEVFKAGGANERGIIVSETDGEIYLALAIDFPLPFENSWRLFVTDAKSDLLSSANNILEESLVISFIILLALLFVVYAAVSRFSEPIRRVARNAELIKDFRLDEVTRVKSRFREVRQMDGAIQAVCHRLRNFEKYVPSELVRQLTSDGKEVALGGEARDLTVLSSGLTGFATMCDELSAEQVTTRLSRYTEGFSSIIGREKGTIDRFSAERITAFWGAPLQLNDGAYRACKAALACRWVEHEIDRHEEMALSVPVRAVFGIHGGPTIVGNFGSSSRLTYTAVGENVDLGAYLRRLNTLYGTRIIISETVYRQVAEDFHCRLLDVIEVGNGARSITLYEVLADSSAPLDVETSRFCRDYGAAFERYRKRDWEGALEQLQTIEKERGEDPSVSLLIQRCEAFRNGTEKAAELPDDWNGSAHPASGRDGGWYSL